MKTVLRSKYRNILVILLALLLIGSSVTALVQPEIRNFTLSAGGQSSGSGGWTLSGSFGQHDAGGTLSGGDFTLAGGFWGAGGESRYSVYIPLILK